MAGPPTPLMIFFLEFQGESSYSEEAMLVLCQQLVWLASGHGYGNDPKADAKAFELLLRLGSDNLGYTCSNLCRLQLQELNKVLHTPSVRRWADHNDLVWAEDWQVLVDDFSESMI